ncbi:TPA: SinI family restriction endonuclease, partial [Pasteurella multocida]|nr:SinI family restriction endonuclease [Pasteurella multocida]
LKNHPDYFSGKVDITTQEGINALWLSFTETRNKPIVLQEPATIPDPAVSEILRAAMGYTDEQLEYIKYTHRLSMAAENKVGELLEMYLAEKLEPFGWVWCSGNFVRAIDFIKKGLDGNWYCLQIKNRNNTENSSSSRVRIGTEIEKWFRTFSTYSVRRGTYTNWENFPDISVREVLSEKDFLDFVNRKIKG